MAINSGDYQTALGHARAAVSTQDELGFQTGMSAQALMSTALCASILGEPDAAIEAAARYPLARPAVVSSAPEDRGSFLHVRPWAFAGVFGGEDLHGSCCLERLRVGVAHPDRRAQHLARRLDRQRCASSN